jgi:hypothetical protein
VWVGGWLGIDTEFTEDTESAELKAIFSVGESIAKLIAHARGTFNEVEEVGFFVFEKEDAAAAAGGFGFFVEMDAAGFEFRARDFDRINAQSDVAPAGEAVVGGRVDGIVRRINLDDSASREAQEECGWVFVVGEEEFGGEGIDIPIAERRGVAGRHADVFDGKNHGIGDCGARNVEIML